MYPYTQSVNPAVRTHLDSQVALINDISKSLFQSFEKVCGLNIQLVQSMVEETAHASKQILSSDHQSDTIAAFASRAQPMAEKLRAYQQQISSIAADWQVKLAQVTEEHVPQTARSAHALADEVARTASEEIAQHTPPARKSAEVFRPVQKG